jgi:hypothetical protein
MNTQTLATGSGNSVSAQEQRDKALDQLLAFVREQVAGTTRGITLNIHRLPIELFDEDGPFDTVLLRSDENNARRYLVGSKSFGVAGGLVGGTFEVTGFSEGVA